VLDLNERLPDRFVFEPHGHAVAQLAAWIESLIQQVPRHDVAECLEHRLLDAGVLAFEVQDETLDRCRWRLRSPQAGQQQPMMGRPHSLV
jgi:hypothetical protein